MALAVGIDLGTTNSAIAYIDEHGKPVVIPNDLGDSITPSVICFKDGEQLIGDDGKEMQALGMYPVAAFFKRQMGDELFIFHVDGVDYSSTELSTLLLKKLKKDAEAHLGETITDAVITVPAYFRNHERQATIEAGKAAGINVLQVVNEPTAAAVAYGLNKTQKKQRILIYDLGGGTFDVTLLELDKDHVRVKNSDGDHQLGGKDWDDRIIEYLASKFQDEYGIDPLEDAESLADLLVQVEDAKKRLTSFEKTVISIVHEGRKGKYDLDRATFEQITSDLMERTMSMTLRVLEDMRLKPSHIDGVLLVGGSTRMPMVHQFIKKKFGKLPMTGINVDEAVALGAALVAEERSQSKPIFALKGRIKTIDVTNHSLGMIAINQDQTAYVNSIILPKNAEIPCQETRPYQHRTRSKGENQLEIFMTQGESESPEDVAYLGRYVVEDIPYQKGGLTVIDIGYHYDESGTVQVDAKDRKNKNKLKIKIEKLPDDVPQRFMKPPELQVDEPECMTAYLAFDLSGSMDGRPLKEAKKAALGFLNNSDLSHCSIGIIAFSDKVKTKLKASQNARKIKNAINDLTMSETGYGNDTHPFDEINNLMNRLEGRRFGLVLADGVWYNQNKAIKRAKQCHSNDIDIIAIGFGGADKKFLKAIASSDEDSFYTSMEGLVETFSTIAQVLAETGGGNEQKGGKRGIGLLSRLKGI
jgi:molecular chaperone DnaK (HSP70)